MKKIALITLHGMGEYKPNYYVELREKLIKKFASDWEQIAFHPVQYASVFQDPQNQLWDDMNSEPTNELDFVKLRKFMLFSFGDAGSLAHSSGQNTDKYIEVQKSIVAALNLAYSEVGPDGPVVILAQSLGCQVISNYIWDAEMSKNYFDSYVEPNEGKRNFMKLRTLTNLITTGCNIPMFNSGLANRQCFSKPNDEFKWDNYYDADDVLGWPLKQLGQSFNVLVKDHEINAGNIFSSWSPFSHGKYWNDKDVLNPLTSILRSKLQ